MTHTPHELHEEFPNHAGKITELKVSNPHFARLMDEYHALNQAVHRAETNLEPTEELHEVELRKKRAQLKDALYRMLAG